jgi:hypothetical protein
VNCVLCPRNSQCVTADAIGSARRALTPG